MLPCALFVAVGIYPFKMRFLEREGENGNFHNSVSAFEMRSVMSQKCPEMLTELDHIPEPRMEV